MKSQTQVDEAAVKQYNEEQKDWTAICRHCHLPLSGTLSELRAHICEVKRGE